MSKKKNNNKEKLDDLPEIQEEKEMKKTEAVETEAVETEAVETEAVETEVEEEAVETKVEKGEEEMTNKPSLKERAKKTAKSSKPYVIGFLAGAAAGAGGVLLYQKYTSNKAEMTLDEE